MTNLRTTQISRGTNTKQQNNKKGKGNKYQASKGWMVGVTKGTLKGVIISNSKDKAPQFIEMIRKVALYYG